MIRCLLYPLLALALLVTPGTFCGYEHARRQSRPRFSGGARRR